MHVQTFGDEKFWPTRRKPGLARPGEEAKGSAPENRRCDLQERCREQAQTDVLEHAVLQAGASSWNAAAAKKEDYVCP